MVRHSRRAALAAGAAALTAAMLGGTSGCARRSRVAHRLAASVQGMMAEFMQLWVRAARLHPAVDRGLATLTVFDGRMDALTQANEFDTIITERFDAIIFIPVDVRAGIEPAKRARAAGIPIVGSNTLLGDRSLYASYIGSDDVEGGKIVARAVVERIHAKGNVVILEGPIGHSAQIQRRQGIAAVLAQFPGVRVLARKAADWSRAEALALMENWLTAYPHQIDGVIAQNDEMALGALESLKAHGVDPATVPVAGIDGITDALEAVKRGEMFTILQDATAQAQGAIDLALRALIGPSYRPMSSIWQEYPGRLDWGDGTRTDYMVPWVPVTRENVDRLLATRRGA